MYLKRGDSVYIPQQQCPVPYGPAHSKECVQVLQVTPYREVKFSRMMIRQTNDTAVLTPGQLSTVCTSKLITSTQDGSCNKKGLQRGISRDYFHMSRNRIFTRQ